MLTIVLGDLIPGWLVLIEVMLSIEATDGLDLTIQRNGCAESGEESGRLEFLHRISPHPTCTLTSHELADCPEMPDRTRRHWN